MPGFFFYSVMCFAILFSFVGTVLGGLWADDSWGRFWGWDPKENGALIIVLWNALVLHARWDGMVRERGLAVLSIGGNIVTSWSWFGVNELGVGLHSYGFTEGVLRYLTMTVIAHLLVISLAIIPWAPRAQRRQTRTASVRSGPRDHGKKSRKVGCVQPGEEGHHREQPSRPAQTHHESPNDQAVVPPARTMCQFGFWQNHDGAKS